MLPISIWHLARETSKIHPIRYMAAQQPRSESCWRTAQL